MKERYKKYSKIGIIPMIFIGASFIVTTFAWFAYSGLKHVSTEIDVKTWYIEMTKNGESTSNEIVITVNNIYPGMETVDEVVNVQNRGDSTAQLGYKVLSARILDAEYTESLELEDSLSHDYPFHVNINMSKNYLLPDDDSSTFEVSVSWPLDSKNDTLDSTWGMNAFDFQQSEKELKNQNSEYIPKSSIQIVISLTAEQYLESEDASDTKYNLGDTILYDVVKNKRCTILGNSCIRTTIIDVNNTLSDNNVTLLPNLYDDYSESTFDNYSSTFNTIINGWTAPTRSITVEDLVSLISTDVINSFLNADDISPQIVGNLKYGSRLYTEVNKAISLEGYYTFLNTKFSYLSSSGCYWTSSEYDINNGFAFGKLNELKGQIYFFDKTEMCSVVPLIVAPKSNL